MTLLRTGCALALLLGATTAAADSPDAFDTALPLHNEAALARTFTLPALGAPHVLAPGHTQLRATVDWTNEFVNESAGSESLTEDGETQRYALDLRRGLALGDAGPVEFGLTLPVFVINGGVLDPVIQNYHNVFGFPNGGRELVPRHRVLYQYTRDGQTLLNVHQSAFALGDIALNAGWQVKPDLALRAALTLPTGRSQQLTGGNTGGAIWVDFDPLVDLSSRWFGTVSLGGSYNETGDVLPSLQRHAILLGEVMLGVHLSPRLSLLAQVYGHSPLYKDTAEGALHDVSAQGGFGGRYVISTHVAVEAAFQEDLVVGASPDFSMHFGLVLR